MASNPSSITTILGAEPGPSDADRRRSRLLGALAALIAAGLAAVAAWELRGWSAASVPMPTGDLVELTAGGVAETSPTLSPDGEWVAYRSTAAGNGDIHLRHVGEGEVINLTGDSPDDESDPAFSPDGETLAFRSARQGGGIYLMRRDGDSVRRLTSFGVTPAWTPDGQSIVFATRSGVAVSPRAALSEGWIVEVATGGPRRLTRGDFRHPSVSPGGRRIAYWAIGDAFGRRGGSNLRADIWTMRLDGTAPVRLTDDTALDWSPVWSSDGRFVYFLSDRGGGSAIWRVPVNERTGRALGPPVELLLPRMQPGSIARSGDGRRLAWSTFSAGRTVNRLELDADARVVRGSPEVVATGAGTWVSGALSPDGTSVVLASGLPDEDIYVSRAGESMPRRLTAGPASDRAPRWSPDGRQIAFQSNRSGRYAVWLVAADGDNLRLVAQSPGELVHPIWSPDGARMAAWDTAARRLQIYALGEQPARDPVETLPAFQHGELIPGMWSPDGTAIAGTGAGAVWVYWFSDRTYDRIGSGTAPVWLSDSRLLLYAFDGRILMADAVRKFTRELVTIPGEDLDTPSLSRDDRHLFFSRPRTDASIWLMTAR